MSVFKLCAKGWVIAGALVLLNGCSSEKLTQDTHKKGNESVEVVPKQYVPKQVTGISNQTSRVIARVTNPKVLLKKTLNGVEDLIGKAHFTRREGNTIVLQYKKDWCVLDIFFYGPEGQQESTYYEFRSREQTNINISECINKMVNN